MIRRFALGVILATLWSCGVEGSPDDVETVRSGIHECAEGFPVPDGLLIIESSQGRAQDGSLTCVISMRSRSAADAAGTSLRSELEAAGNQVLVERDEEISYHMRMEGPICGVALGFPASTPGVLPEDPDDDRTGSVLVASLIPCDRMPPRAS